MVKRMQIRTLLRAKSLWLIMVLTGFAVATWTCKYPTGPQNPNTPPHTRLANVPANDTIARYIQRNAFPELQLDWVGDDPDGYVIGFQYRWTTTMPGQPFPAPGPWTTLLNITKSDWQNVIVVKGTPSSYFNVYNFLATLGPNDTSLIRIIGDSLATNHTFAVPYKTGIIPTDSVMGATLLTLQTPTIGTFIFDSPADSNFHRFEIRSVDNSGEADPFPATVYFWTLESPGSVVTFDSSPTGNPFAIRYKTGPDRWPGLHFTYHALDANNSFGFQFQWAVDDTLTWSPWTDSQEAYVTAIDFKPLLTGTHQHVFHVRAKNRWGVLSPDSTRTFTATVPQIDDPAWPKRTLVINDVVNWTSGSGTRGRPSIVQIDGLYSEVMDSLGKAGQFDMWDIASRTAARWPIRDTLGYYSSVLIILPVAIPNIGVDASVNRFAGSATTPPQSDFRDYLLIGGKLIWDGSPSMATAIQGFTSPNQLSGTWATDIFHLIPNTAQSPYIVSVGLDFNGVRGGEGYPDVRLDTNKIAPDSATAMRNIGNIGINFPYGFAQTTSYFHSKYGTFYENLPVGVRFLAPPPDPPARQTYSVVFFGFPLYYAEKTDIIQSLRKGFQDINE